MLCVHMKWVSGTVEREELFLQSSVAWLPRCYYLITATIILYSKTLDSKILLLRKVDKFVLLSRYYVGIYISFKGGLSLITISS